MIRPEKWALLFGRILFMAFLLAPTYPVAITGWDSVTSWEPGCFLVIRESMAMMGSISDAVSFSREYAANPYDFRGDGPEVFYRDMAWTVLRHLLILTSSIVMGICAIVNLKRGRWRYGAFSIVTAGLFCFVWDYLILSQTYVGGRHHIGFGVYLWIGACLAIVAAMNANSEQESAPNAR